MRTSPEHQRYVLAEAVTGAAPLPAHDALLNRGVMLQLLSGDLSSPAVLEEARALARLRHPNVVVVHDAGVLGDKPFISFERVRGRPLSEWLGERPRSCREIVRVMLDAGRGLLAMHEVGVPHRGFGPEAVLVVRDGDRVVLSGLLPRTVDGGTRRDQEISADVRAFYTTLERSLVRCAGRVPPRLRRLVEAGVRGEVGLSRALARLSPVPGFRRWMALGVLLCPAMSIGLWGLWGLTGGRKLATPDCALATPPTLSYGSGRRAQIARALRRAPVKPAEGSIQSVIAALDAYSRGWSSAARSLCREQPAATPVTAACLDDARLRFEALISIFENADARIAGNALAAIESLPRPSSCLAGASPAESASPSRSAHALRSVREGLARAAALSSTAQHAEAEGVLAPLEPSVRALAYPPLESEFWGTLGGVWISQGRYREAAEALERALVAGRAGGDLYLVARAAARLGEVMFLQQRLRDALEWAAHGDAAVAAIGQRAGTLPADIAMVRAAVAFSERSYEEAAGWFEAVVRVEEAVLGPDDPRLIVSLGNLGLVLGRTGHLTRAVGVLERAVALVERLRGENHPDLVLPLSHLGSLQQERGAFRDAGRTLERAVRIAESTLDPRDRMLEKALRHRGEWQLDMGDGEGALRSFERSRDIALAAVPRTHPEVLRKECGVARALFMMGRRREAISRMLALTKQAERSLGPHHVDVATFQTQLSRLLVQSGRGVEALAFASSAKESLGRRQSELPVEVAEVHGAVGESLAVLGRLDEAAAELVDARRILERAPESNRRAMLKILVPLALVQAQRGLRVESLEALELGLALADGAPPGATRAQLDGVLGARARLEGEGEGEASELR